jgi:hypothetical protein
MLRRTQRCAASGLKPTTFAGVADLLKLSDAELARFAAHERSTASPGLFVPVLSAPYTRAAIGVAHDLHPDYALRVLDILAHIDIYNDVRENHIYHQRLTFTPGVSDENHSRVVRNAEHAVGQLAERARVIVDKIVDLEQR